MYYFYDLLLNFQDENLYEFYEWEENDNVEFIKKIPLFKVSNTCLKDALKYKLNFSIELLSKIKNKTTVKNRKEPLEYTFLISDSKNALALELNEEGSVISRSKLLISDEINLCEIMFTIKETHLEYKKLKPFKTRKFIRQVEDIKKIITCEIDTLYQEKNSSKLKYLYFEWFNEMSDDIELMYKKMKEELKKKVSEKELKISKLIKLSYNK